jgi:predicted nucleic acid-binding protein
MIVVDTNIIGYLFLTGSHSEQAEQALRKDPLWLAPLLWRSEFRNVLALYMRRNLLSLDDAVGMMESAINLMRGGEYEIASTRVLALANQSGCSAYDCEFVSLAEDSRVPLVTVDKQILANFSHIAMSLEEFCR